MIGGRFRGWRLAAHVKMVLVQSRVRDDVVAVREDSLLVSLEGGRAGKERLRPARTERSPPQRKEFDLDDLIDHVRAGHQVLDVGSNDQLECALRYAAAIHDCWAGGQVG